MNELKTKQAVTLIFATNNQHKAEEIKNIIGNQYRIITLQDAGISIDIPEPFDTLEENAKEKARVIYEITKQNCFSEDTGLEVEALNGEPGVKSARYAGDDKNVAANIDKLLLKMQQKQTRNAQFKTVISLIVNHEFYLFTGVCKGVIAKQQSGDGGFGYDSVFIPDGSNKTFAQMTVKEKNTFSHRRKATDQLIEFLKGLSDEV